MKLKDYQGAIKAFDKAISLDENYGYAYMNRGNAKELVRDQKGACADWLKASELNVKQAASFAQECQ